MTVDDDVTVKRFASEVAAAHEAKFYRLVPWACPLLIEVAPSTLTFETLPVATDVPSWRPAGLLRELLHSIHQVDVHHRDLHVHNVVKGPAGPLLIDWEVAVVQPSDLSYDLHGPKASGVPVPALHARLEPAWWYASRPSSIRNAWEVEC